MKERSYTGIDRVYYLGGAVDQGSHDYPPTQQELDKVIEPEQALGPDLQKQIDELNRKVDLIVRTSTILDMEFNNIIEYMGVCDSPLTFSPQEKGITYKDFVAALNKERAECEKDEAE